MRVKNKSNASCLAVARLFENCFEPSVRDGNKNIASGIHKLNLPNDLF